VKWVRSMAKEEKGGVHQHTQNKLRRVNNE
jgi:hypothetical protein